MVSDIVVVCIVTRCSPGAEISRAMREAIILALTERRDVQFVHNDRAWLIKPDQVVSGVLEGS